MIYKNISKKYQFERFLSKIKNRCYHIDNDGQVFDAYAFVAKLIKSAEHSIKLVDNYIDESVLTLFSKNQDVQVKRGESIYFRYYFDYNS